MNYLYLNSTPNSLRTNASTWVRANQVSSDPDIPPPQRSEAPGPRTGYMGTLHIYNDYRDIFYRFTQYFQFAILAQDVMEPLESPRILYLFFFYFFVLIVVHL